jgi:hypothetical protein
MQKSAVSGSQAIGVSVGGIVGEIGDVGVFVAVGGIKVDVGKGDEVAVSDGSGAGVAVSAGAQEARKKSKTIK